MNTTSPLYATGIHELDRIGREKVATAPEGECELLYGRAGYLQGLLFLRKRLSRPDVFSELIMLLIRQIIRVGLNGETLLWHWHGTPYLGTCMVNRCRDLPLIYPHPFELLNYHCYTLLMYHTKAPSINGLWI